MNGLSIESVACAACGYVFNHSALGKYGCPNCEGEGLDQEGPWINTSIQLPPHNTPVLAFVHAYVKDPYQIGDGYAVAMLSLQDPDGGDLLDFPQWWDVHGCLIEDAVQFWMPIPTLNEPL
jgi:hypothetical protein